MVVVVYEQRVVPSQTTQRLPPTHDDAPCTSRLAAHEASSPLWTWTILWTLLLSRGPPLLTLGSLFYAATPPHWSATSISRDSFNHRQLLGRLADVTKCASPPLAPVATVLQSNRSLHVDVMATSTPAHGFTVAPVGSGTASPDAGMPHGSETNLHAGCLPRTFT